MNNIIKEQTRIRGLKETQEAWIDFPQPTLQKKGREFFEYQTYIPEKKMIVNLGVQV